MNGLKPPGRSRPTNNQLLYKAHFRWNHYTNDLHEGTDMPSGTEACASVTSAFLQVLATIHAVESARVKKPRNVLHILSTNTRRTKVVELSTGTHRVADDLRRHSLSDGAGGHYSTNLDRNRYGSDNNYLFTVTRYDLEALGLCPCLVDIEIVDTRNGNESQLVTCGEAECSCNSPERQELADVSHFAGSYMAGGGAPVKQPSPHREMRRAVSTGHLNGMRRVASQPGLRRPPSQARLHEYGGRTHSRGNSGSELFDALLLAATGEADVRSHGEAAVTSKHPIGGGNGQGGGQAAAGTGHKAHRAVPAAPPQQQQLHQRYGSLTEADSLQNAVDAFKGGDDEDGKGHGSNKKPMLRRNSVSMILENPALAQTGAVDSLIMNYFPYGMAAALHGVDGPERENSGEGAGDTEGHGDGDAIDGDDPNSIRQGLLRHFHKQSSAVNLSRLALSAPAEVRRLQEEVKNLREEKSTLEDALEESKLAKKTAEDDCAAAEERMASAQDACRRAGDVIQRLRQLLTEARTAAGLPPPADADVDPSEMQGLQTSDQEIQLLRSQIADMKAQLAKVQSEKREVENRLLRKETQGKEGGNSLPRGGSLHSIPHAAALAAMPYAAMSMLPPLFGMPPLNPYGGLNKPPSSGGGGGNNGAMQKVKSMPAIHQGTAMSPSTADRDAARRDAALKRKDPPIPEASDEGNGSGPNNGGASKKQAVAGDEGKPAVATSDHANGDVVIKADDASPPSPQQLKAAQPPSTAASPAGKEGAEGIAAKGGDEELATMMQTNALAAGAAMAQAYQEHVAAFLAAAAAGAGQPMQ